MALFFGALTLGPFIFIGGVNTYVVGPWALLRYVPLVSAARMPGRFAIVLMMAFAVIFALALRHVRARWGDRRGLVLAVVAALLAFELAPLPRQLYAASVPDIYGQSPAIHATFACWTFRWASWTARAARAETTRRRSTTRRSIRSRLSAAACRASPCGSASGSGCSR